MGYRGVMLQKNNVDTKAVNEYIVTAHFGVLLPDHLQKGPTLYTSTSNMRLDYEIYMY